MGALWWNKQENNSPMGICRVWEEVGAARACH